MKFPTKMPKAPTSKKSKSASHGKNPETKENFEFGDEDHQEDFSESQENQSPLKAGKKRSYDEVEDEQPVETNIDGEMQNMLQTFGADMRKSMSSKKKRLENFTQQTLKAANTKVDKIWKLQQTERQRLQEEYNKQLNMVLEQWETDVKKMKDQDDKLQTMFKQQQRLMQQNCIAINQRLKNIKQLFEQYNKTMADLETCHRDQQGNIQGELRKEMNLLHKKIMMDNQHQEMANFRKSLQSMFF